MSMIMWVLAVLGCVLLGIEGGKLLFTGNEKLAAQKRALQQLSIKLREFGLRIIPDALDEFVLTDTHSLVEKLHDLSLMVKGGDQAMIKELEATYESILNKKLLTPEGLALIKAKVAEAEKILAAVAPVVLPAVEIAVKAAAIV